MMNIYLKLFLTLKNLSNIIDDILKFLLRLMLIHLFEYIINGEELLNDNAITYMLIIIYGSILYNIIINIWFKKNRKKSNRNLIK